MSDFQDYGMFSPLFDRESDPEDEQPSAPPPDDRPEMWRSLANETEIEAYSIAHFLPHLSNRTQSILHTLGTRTVGDLLRTDPSRILACERANETVLIEIEYTILEYKGLSLKGRPRPPAR
jgi:hypothetical protein